MKPRTKRERLLCQLAEKLPQLTDNQRTYPKEHIHPHKGYYWKSGLIWCQCCGKLYPNTHAMMEVSLELGVDICPNCGKEIKLEHARAKMKYEQVCSYYAIITTYQGWQVIRTFEAWRINSKGKPTEYHVNEVFQLWIDEKGRETIVSHKYTRGYNFLHWLYNSEFVVYNHNHKCTGYYDMPDLFDINGFHIYPRASVLQTVKRNGWNSTMLKLNVNHSDLIQELLTNRRIETIAKAHQYSILEYWMRHKYSISEHYDNYFNPVKIAIRNGYIVDDASIWYDMIESLRYLNLDTRNAHYVCPKELMRAHDYYMERSNRKKAKEQIDKERDRIIKCNTSYVNRMGKFIGIIFGDDDLNIHVLRDVTEFFEEGIEMHHCVYTNRYYNRADTLIMSAVSNGKRIATIELNLKTMNIIQVRGKCNTVPPRDEEIRSMITKNLGLIRKAKHIRLDDKDKNLLLMVS